MSDFKLDAYGSPDCSDIREFSPKGAFFIAVEFDIKFLNQEGCATYWFFLCNQEGFDNQKYSEELESVVIIDRYSFQFVETYLQEKVIEKKEAFSNSELIQYLDTNFNFEE